MKTRRSDIPWKTRTAAYTPIFVFAVGSKLVLNVAMVEMKVAHAKLQKIDEHQLFSTEYAQKGS